MEYTYEVIEGTLGSSMILRSDGAYIPMVEANADYQAYLNKDKPVEHFTPNLS
jgi:hypothetical protein